MTIKECYDQMHGDYTDAKSRLMSDRLIEKFMLKFLQDDTMRQLTQALQAQDYEMAFQCAHTLKGVAGNLSFKALQESASRLTEALRNDKSEPDAAIVEQICADYKLVTEVLNKYQND